MQPDATHFLSDRLNIAWNILAGNVWVMHLWLKYSIYTEIPNCSPPLIAFYNCPSCAHHRELGLRGHCFGSVKKTLLISVIRSETSSPRPRVTLADVCGMLHRIKPFLVRWVESVLWGAAWVFMRFLLVFIWHRYKDIKNHLAVFHPLLLHSFSMAVPVLTSIPYLGT